eukprot:316710_1
MSQSAHCNHFSTCSYCHLVLTRKCEQSKMLHGLLRSLQSQHAHHVSFVGTLCDAITNTKQRNNKTSKSKNRRKPINPIKANQASYDPPSAHGLNVKIPKPLTEDIIPQTVKNAAPIAPATQYSYLKKSIAMQHNDKQLHLNQDHVVVHVDFHETKGNELLYCVMSKIQHQPYNWQVHHKLYTAAELASFGTTALP